MSLVRRGTPGPLTRGYSSRRLAPVIEVVEPRQLLATGFGVIAGTAFVDVNNDATLDTTDPYLPGATIQLFQAGSSTPIASQTTDAHGGYAFTGLASGTYVVSETPPARSTVTGTQVLSQVEPGTSLPGQRIQVTVPVNPFFLNYNGVNPGTFQVANVLVNGTPELDSIGALDDTLGSTSGATDINPGFLSYCLDDLQRLTFAG